jgi:hypothetical protein
MSNIKALKEAVKANLQITLNVTDEFQGELPGLGPEALLDAQILRAANNARQWAERQHDFAENDVAVRLYYKADYPCYPFGIDNTDQTNFNEPWYLAPHVTIQPGGTGGLLYHNYGELIQVADSIQLMEIVNPGQVDDDIGYGEITGVKPNQVTIQYEDGPDPGEWFNQLGYTTAFNSSSGRRQLFHLKTINSAYIVENNDAYRPIWVRSKKDVAHRSRKDLDLETEEPYLRYPGDDKFERDTTQPYLYHQGEKIGIVPEQDLTLVLEGNRWMPAYRYDTDTDFLLRRGFDWMMWAVIVDVNHITQTFVPRSEGNLPPPVRMRDEAWFALIANDEYRFEGSAPQQ